MFLLCGRNPSESDEVTFSCLIVILRGHVSSLGLAAEWCVRILARLEIESTLVLCLVFVRLAYLDVVFA